MNVVQTEKHKWKHRVLVMMFTLNVCCADVRIIDVNRSS